MLKFNKMMDLQEELENRKLIRQVSDDLADGLILSERMKEKKDRPVYGDPRKLLSEDDLLFFEMTKAVEERPDAVDVDEMSNLQQNVQRSLILLNQRGDYNHDFSCEIEGEKDVPSLRYSDEMIRDFFDDATKEKMHDVINTVLESRSAMEQLNESDFSAIEKAGIKEIIEFIQNALIYNFKLGIKMLKVISHVKPKLYISVLKLLNVFTNKLDMGIILSNMGTWMEVELDTSEILEFLKPLIYRYTPDKSAWILAYTHSWGLLQGSKMLQPASFIAFTNQFKHERKMILILNEIIQMMIALDAEVSKGMRIRLEDDAKTTYFKLITAIHAF